MQVGQRYFIVQFEPQLFVRLPSAYRCGYFLHVSHEAWSVCVFVYVFCTAGHSGKLHL